MINRRRLQRLTFVIFLVIVATFQIGGCRRPKPPPVPVPTPSPTVSPNACNCSIQSLVCSVGTSTCVAVECDPVAYKDGRCSSYGGPAIPQPLRSDTAELFGLSFSSYEGAIQSSSGGPDAETWDRITKEAPSEDIANAVKYMTNDFLYISLGHDFKALTIDGLSGACEIASVSDKTAALLLVNAIKTGTMQALEESNPASVKGPIDAFFKQYPSYKPNNPGYCYSENNPGTPMDCIGGALEIRLGLLVGTQ